MAEDGLLGLLLPEATGEMVDPALLDPRAAENLALLQLVALLGGKPIDDVAARLRWSKRDLSFGRKMVESLPALAGVDDPRARFRLLKGGQETVPALAALGLSWKALSPRQASDLLAAHWQRVDHPLPRLVDGNVLVKELGLKAGPHIATLLAGIEEAQALGEITDRASALAWVAAQPGE
jgi:hypothetical protein